MVEIGKERHPLLDLIQVAFIITDIHSKILYTNRYAEDLFGFSREEMERERIRILFLEEDLTYFLPNIIYLTLYKNGFEGEALLRQKDGTRVFVHLSTHSFKEEGEVFLTFSLQEIQRLKKLEREKIEMEHWKNLGMMVEEIAHQIRNPIVSIGGYAQRLLKTLPPSPKSKSYGDQILRATRRLEKMIQRIEEYILLPMPVFEKENIQDVVEAAVQKFSEEAIEKRVLFNLETGGLEGDGNLFIDRNLMIRTLSHILNNSIEALKQRACEKKRMTVNVVLFGSGEGVGISVSDKGEGIAKKNIDQIFDPFFSTRPDQVGLGLTIAKKVVEEHGGRIRVESRLRRGTTVTITLPKDRRRRIRREFVSPETMERRDG